MKNNHDCDKTNNAATTKCTGTFLQRAAIVFKTMLEEDSWKTMRLNAAMTCSDLLVAYYYRTLQTEQLLHVCKLGYCRGSWSEKCKFNLPWPHVVSVMYQDDDLGRLIPRRSNLEDDAWVKIHSLPLLVRSLMNVQTNQHHPEAANRGLGYSIKYDLKSEPQARVALPHHTDDAVTEYFRGQFVSVSQAAAFVLEDPITSCTHGASPLAIPSWVVHGNRHCQGFWRRYTTRLPYEAPKGKSHREGFSSNIAEDALCTSLLFATFTCVMRYFGETRENSGGTAQCAEEAEQDAVAKGGAGSAAVE